MKTFFTTIILLQIAIAFAQTWSQVDTGINGNVEVLFSDTATGQIYAGGQFTVAGGIAANNIAKWNGTNWDSLGQGLNNGVYALAVYNNELYCAGNFTTAGGIALNYIAKWDESNWFAVDGGTNDLVKCLKEYNGELYVGGFFSNAGSVSTNNIARWNGSIWSPVSLGISGNSVWSLTIKDNDLYLGGSFSMADTVSANNIAKWNGSAWSTVGSPITAFSIKSLSVYIAGLFVGGSILSPGSNILKWTSPFTPVLPVSDFYANHSTFMEKPLNLS